MDDLSLQAQENNVICNTAYSDAQFDIFTDLVANY